MQPVTDIEGVHERVSDGMVSEFGACRLSLRPEHDGLTYSFIDHSEEEDVPCSVSRLH